MPESILTYRGTVYPWHCDHMGHMNVMWYVGKFDEASWQLFASVGLTGARFHQDKFGMAGLEQHIEYKRELHAGDVISIRSSFEEVREKSVRFLHEMTNDLTQELAARTTLVAVCMDIHARKSRPLPGDIRERIAAVVPGGAREQKAPVS